MVLLGGASPSSFRGLRCCPYLVGHCCGGSVGRSGWGWRGGRRGKGGDGGIFFLILSSSSSSLRLLLPRTAKSLGRRGRHQLPARGRRPFTGIGWLVYHSGATSSLVDGSAIDRCALIKRSEMRGVVWSHAAGPGMAAVLFLGPAGQKLNDCCYNPDDYAQTPEKF